MCVWLHQHVTYNSIGPFNLIVRQIQGAGSLCPGQEGVGNQVAVGTRLLTGIQSVSE